MDFGGQVATWSHLEQRRGRTRSPKEGNFKKMHKIKEKVHKLDKKEEVGLSESQLISWLVSWTASKLESQLISQPVS